MKQSNAKIKSRVSGIDLPFLVLVLILVCFGLVMLYSASYAVGYYRMGDAAYYISDQIVFAVVGIIIMFVVSRVDYHILHKFALPLMGVTVALLVIVPLNNSKRWIVLPFMTIQPSEIAKFAVILLFAHWISLNRSRMHTLKYGVVPYIGTLTVVAALLLLEPHLSGTVLVLSIGAVLMFVGGTKLVYFITAAGVAIAGMVFMIFSTDYATARIELWQDPFAFPQGDGFQTIQSMLAIGSGGLFGMGLGQSRQKHLYLPEPQNDFIFSVLCEELGFVGAILVMMLFVLLLVRGIYIAVKARDMFGSLLVVGIMAQVTLQALLNIGVVTNTIPNTGISLPFFSDGGTSLLMLLGEMGVVLSVSRQSRITKG